ncbi:XdhC family protein [Luteimonas aquatica]|uniref:XdhC family protein n=1 Tax=Luteimonas aquatica TaxID=450364 RepID=UPI001F5A3F94|nr:XdhC/CoxI family protein [Luteimonas aquatica]
MLEAALRALREDDAATLAVVVDTEGSTYARAGALALFGAGSGQAGWLSGGCLEPAIERLAAESAADGRLRWMEIDTREDEDLLSGSALGCRGRLRLALLPLRGLPDAQAPLAAWQRGRAPLALSLGGDGAVAFSAGGERRDWRLPTEVAEWATAGGAWTLRIEAPPEILVLGAGPETPLLLPLLRQTGWRTTLAERRERWRAQARFADRHLDAGPAAALGMEAAFDAVLVMHHNFELDREALDALAGSAIAFVGLLGPARRREDLFRVLPAACREALSTRLRSPVGLRLGGQGPQAIALSIAAQLQAWRHGDGGG